MLTITEGGSLTNSDQHVNPDLPITDSLEEILDVVFIGQRRAIVFESALNFLALLLCEELGGLGEIVNLEEGPDSDKKSNKTFQNLRRSVVSS